MKYILQATSENMTHEIVKLVTRALKGNGGSSRMAQGGLNVVLNPADFHGKHVR